MVDSILDGRIELKEQRGIMERQQQHKWRGQERINLSGKNRILKGAAMLEIT